MAKENMKYILKNPLKIKDADKSTKDFILALFMIEGDDAVYSTHEEIEESLNTVFADYRKEMAKVMNNPSISIRKQSAISKAMKNITKFTYNINGKNYRIKKINGEYRNWSLDNITDDIIYKLSTLKPFKSDKVCKISANVYAYNIYPDKADTLSEHLKEAYIDNIFDTFVHNDKFYVVLTNDCPKKVQTALSDFPERVAIETKKQKRIMQHKTKNNTTSNIENNS